MLPLTVVRLIVANLYLGLGFLSELLLSGP